MLYLIKPYRAAVSAFSVAVMIGLAGMSSVALATTPDGETPANEGVCDILKGGTPGLYGLCVAYCEAQDLDTIEKEPPNTKILENYRKKMQAGDPDMPCVQAPCVCWSAEELASITGDGVISTCLNTEFKIQIIDDGPLHFADADKTTGRERCRYVDTGLVPPTVRSQTITAEQAQVCFDALSQACSALGF